MSSVHLEKAPIQASASILTDHQEPSRIASRSDAGVPKVLARNSACHQCRKRKLKCDALKPICTNCAKPRVRSGQKGESQGGSEPCTWDAPKEPSARTRRRRESARRQAQAAGQAEGPGSEEDDDDDEAEVLSKKAKLNELENRIAACQHALEVQKQSSSSVRSSDNPTSQSTSYSQNQSSSLDSSYSRPQSYIPKQEPYTYTHPPFYLGYMEDIPVRPPGASTPPSNERTGTNAATTRIFPQAQRDDLLDMEASARTLRAEMVIGAARPVGGHMRQGRPAPSEPTPEVVSDIQGEDLESYDGLFDLVWPDWPKDLPTFAVVERIVKVFFEKIPTLPRMVPKAQFMQSLLLPPSHPNFPVRPLLHAILAVSSNFVSETSLATRAYFPVGASSSDILHPVNDFESTPTPGRFTAGTVPMGHHQGPSTPLGRFQLWHRRKAFETFATCLDRGDKFLQCLQSYVIATTVDQYNAWWTDLWLESGACVRMATPMRINETTNVPEGSLRRYSNFLLEPAKTAMEQAERDRTWWMVYFLERAATVSTTWPTALADDEISTELPVLQEIFDRGYGDLSGVQNLQSPDLLTSHPDRHRDSFCLLLKALKLHTDVNVFFRKYSRGQHSIAGYLSHPTFRVLLSQINSFRMSFPPEFRRPTQFKVGGGVDALDRDLIAALWIAHGASMSLGEPLVTKDSWTQEGARMTLAAIRAALSLLYDTSRDHFAVTLFSPTCSFAWCLASRGLIRFVDAASESGDPVSASVFRSEIEVFRLALRRYGERFPLGNRHLKMVDDLLSQLNAHHSVAKSYELIYDCTKKDVFGTREVGATSQANITELTSSSSHGIVTPGGTMNSSSSTPQDANTSESYTNSLLDFDPSQQHQKHQQTRAQGQSQTQNQQGGYQSVPQPQYPSQTQTHPYASRNTNLYADTSTNTSVNPDPLNPNVYSNVNVNTSVFTGFNTSPADPQDSWDISSFSFDINAVASFFESTGATFDGNQFNMTL
ncbi:hypothetical protein I317_00874 [Kwoniella heveanensis CBS 569]|nr:hypothetical protein I317_00874 [Kwoniella heveanensis CBS 569]